MTRLTKENLEEIRKWNHDWNDNCESLINELLDEIDALRNEQQVGLWDTVANLRFCLEGMQKERDAALARIEKLRAALQKHYDFPCPFEVIAQQALTEDDEAARGMV